MSLFLSQLLCRRCNHHLSLEEILRRSQHLPRPHTLVFNPQVFLVSSQVLSRLLRLRSNLRVDLHHTLLISLYLFQH